MLLLEILGLILLCVMSFVILTTTGLYIKKNDPVRVGVVLSPVPILLLTLTAMTGVFFVAGLVMFLLTQILLLIERKS